MDDFQPFGELGSEGGAVFMSHVTILFNSEQKNKYVE